MGNIGIPEIVIAMLVIGVPVWAYRGFRLPRNRITRSVLLAVLVLFCAVLIYEWELPYHAVRGSSSHPLRERGNE